jgi:hypothetical protein
VSAAPLCAALAVFALLAQSARLARPGEPEPVPASLAEAVAPAEPIRHADAIALEGCALLPESDLLRLQVPLAEVGETWTAPRPGLPHRALPLWALARARPGGARIDRRAARSIADAIADAYARAGRPGTHVDIADPTPTPDGRSLLLLRIREAEPGLDLEHILREEGAPARVAQIQFRGVSRSWLAEGELRALPLELTRLPGGYCAARSDLPTTQQIVSELERPLDLPIALYPSALQALLDAVGRAYRERGAPGTRVRIARSALRRTLGAGSTGVLEIEISEP